MKLGNQASSLCPPEGFDQIVEATFDGSDSVMGLHLTAMNSKDYGICTQFLQFTERAIVKRCNLTPGSKDVSASVHMNVEPPFFDKGANVNQNQSKLGVSVFSPDKSRVYKV